MKLKPCPFCGNQPEAIDVNTIYCAECDYDTFTHQWNTRHYPQEIIDVIAAAKKVLKELPQLNCSDLHHNKGDRHDWNEDCPPKERYDVASLGLLNALKKLKDSEK